MSQESSIYLFLYICTYIPCHRGQSILTGMCNTTIVKILQAGLLGCHIPALLAALLWLTPLEDQAWQEVPWQWCGVRRPGHRAISLEDFLLDCTILSGLQFNQGRKHPHRQRHTNAEQDTHLLKQVTAHRRLLIIALMYPLKELLVLSVTYQESLPYHSIV